MQSIVEGFQASSNLVNAITVSITSILTRGFKADLMVVGQHEDGQSPAERTSPTVSRAVNESQNANRSLHQSEHIVSQSVRVSIHSLAS